MPHVIGNQSYRQVLGVKHNFKQIKQYEKNLITIWQVIKCDSREPFNPLVVLRSSEEDAKKLFTSYTEEINNENYFKKVIDRKENSVKLLCNHKGWGPDYIISVTIEDRRIEF